MKKIREKLRADAEHPECATGQGGLGHSMLKPSSPSKSRPSKHNSKEKKHTIDSSLSDIKDESERSAHTGNINKKPSADPLSASRPGGRINN
jgi:hypothetical protein